jgi:ubiquinone/menaquinone biosynthesis C-methylase UbiE
MPDSGIQFDDGAAYERMMGGWSRLVGAVFLDWLAPARGLRWIDVGCGNGAFTELIAERCGPAAIDGIDPSDAQLAFARTRTAARLAAFHKGDAMALPFADKSFDAAAMALVLFFVPDPAKGVAEMVRVTRSGGSVSAYLWDVFGGGLPMEPIQAEMRAMGMTPLAPPSAAVSVKGALRGAWEAAGLTDIETREIAVSRSFADFDAFWSVTPSASTLKATIAALGPEKAELLKSRVRARLPTDAAGRITYSARANAVKGRVAG